MFTFKFTPKCQILNKALDHREPLLGGNLNSMLKKVYFLQYNVCAVIIAIFCGKF